MSKETYYSAKETYYSVKRDLLQCQKRPIAVSKETYYSAKETYYSVKRDLLQCQKRPTTVSKETYYSVKKGTSYTINRPKHTHIHAQLTTAIFFFPRVSGNSRL